MPNFARLHYPGAVVHLITRFLNREYLLAGATERQAYLERIPAALARTDWTLMAYALMSNHVHLVLLAGDAPPWLFYQRLHTSFAKWLNRRLGRLGPTVKGRPTTHYLPSARLPQLVAYVHNNPVRAGLVGAAEETDWTSHRMWLGVEAAPAWLDVERGLRLAGFAGTAAGRQGFHAFVLAQASGVHEAGAAEAEELAARTAARAQTGLPVEVSSAVLASDVSAPTQRIVRYHGSPPASARWAGPIDELVRCVAARRGIPVELLCSRSRRRDVVEARRLVIVTGVVLLRRRPVEMAAALGISDAAVSQHLWHGDRLLGAANEVSALLRTSTS